MNERIEAYLKQHYYSDYYNCWGETVDDDHYFMYREEVDGLIEIIVQECVRHFNEDYKRDFMVSWREDLSNSILNHFGIKE